VPPVRRLAKGSEILCHRTEAELLEKLPQGGISAATGSPKIQRIQ
jgi:hypothetical protein